ncbi:MAG TPA: lipopolysaccharide heptosyltransferase II [Candidatus Acidoferrum sp.]|nr:lipopolysaccharide heptosyltransferase II [Candidatus Acidoferrum sp.]
MKILVRATNWVGDAIMALPALRAVRARFPEAEITILARPYVAFLYKGQGVCNNIIDLDYKRDMVSDLRAQKFDTALLLQNAFEAAWFAWRAGIPERIGYARDGRSLLLTKAVPVPKPGEIPAHEQYYYLELLRRVGWLDSLPNDSFIGLDVPEENRQRAAAFLLSNGVRPDSLRVAIGAGASYGSAKCWPPDRFAELANRLHAEDPKAKVDVILFGTRAEAPVSSAIAAGMRLPPVNLTGKTAINDLPALLSQCHLFVGNDSGAMHVAAAVGLPVVAVFGPTDPFGTAPVTPRCSIVQEKPYCSPCFLRRCPTDHRCMTRITSSAVEAAAKKWISTIEVRPA